MAGLCRVDGTKEEAKRARKGRTTGVKKRREAKGQGLNAAGSNQQKLACTFLD